MPRKNQRAGHEWPGGMIGNVPAFNPANVAQVEAGARFQDQLAADVGNPSLVAAEHRDADEACGREWTCQCAACRRVRKGE